MHVVATTQGHFELLLPSYGQRSTTLKKFNTWNACMYICVHTHIYFIYFITFWYGISLGGSDWPWTHNPPASWVLELETGLEQSFADLIIYLNWLHYIVC